MDFDFAIAACALATALDTCVTEFSVCVTSVALAAALANALLHDK